MLETVKEVLDRALKDDSFRRLLLSNPDKALYGYAVTDEEHQLLASLNEDSLEDFAGGLGDRSTKGTWTPGAS